MAVERANIVLITVDSLRADHLSCYGYRRPTSPNIDRLAGEGTRFTHAFSVGPNTPNAFPGMMASQHPLTCKRLGLFDADNVLAELLQSADYRTIGFNAGNPYVSRYFRYDRGFDGFNDYFHLPENGSEWLSSRPVSESIVAVPKLDLRHYVISEENSQEKARLESGINAEVFDSFASEPSQPFFLWVHYMDCHYPYLPQPDSQASLGISPISSELNLQLNKIVRESLAVSPQSLSAIVDLYDAAVRQVDTKVGEVVDFLRTNDLYDSTIIVFTADHGEEFMEHGDLQHKSKLFDELLHVPLIVRFPRHSYSRIRNELVSLTQLAPTLTSAVGLKNRFGAPGLFEKRIDSRQSAREGLFAAAYYGQNGHAPVDKNLLNTDGLPVVHCYRNAQWKLIQSKEKAQAQLFNLLADPGERTDVVHQHPKQFYLLKERLRSQIRYLERERVRAQIRRARAKIMVSQEDHAIPPSF